MSILVDPSVKSQHDINENTLVNVVENGNLLDSEAKDNPLKVEISYQSLAEQIDACEKVKNKLLRQQREVEGLKKTLEYRIEEVEKEKKFIEMEKRQLRANELIVTDKNDRLNRKFSSYIHEKGSFIEKEQKLSVLLSSANDKISEFEGQYKAREEEFEKRRISLDNEAKYVQEQLKNIEDEKAKLAQLNEKFAMGVGIDYFFRSPESEKSFLEHERKLLDVQQRKFYEDKKQFEETRDKFDKRFAEFLREKEKYILMEQQLSDKQRDIELLRDAVVQSEKENKEEKEKLDEIKMMLEKEKDDIDLQWNLLKEEVEKLQQARLSVEVEKEKLKLQYDNIEEYRQQLALYDIHYINIENHVDNIAKSLFLKEVRDFHNLPDDEKIHSFDLVYDLFRKKEAAYRKKIIELKKQVSAEAEDFRRAKILIQKDESSRKFRIEDLEAQLEQCKHELILQKNEYQLLNNDNIALSSKVRKLKEKYRHEKTKRSKYELELERQYVARKIKDQNNNQERSKDNSNAELVAQIRKELQKEFDIKLDLKISEAKSLIKKKLEKRYADKIIRLNEMFDFRINEIKQNYGKERKN